MKKRARKIGVARESLHPDAQIFAGCIQCFARCARQMLRRWSSWCTCIQLWEAYEISRAQFKMINNAVILTYFYLLLYIVLSTVVILYNKVFCCSSLIPCWSFRTSETPPTRLKCKVVHLSRCLICLQWVIFVQLCGIAKVEFCCNLQWVLSTKHYGFPYPITLTMIHMAFSGSVAFILVRVFKVSSPFPLVPASMEDFTAM